MCLVSFRNCEAVLLSKIPETSFPELKDAISESARKGARPVLFFGYGHGVSDVRLFVCLAHDSSSELLLGRSSVPRGGSFESLTPEFPAFQSFEREIFEQTGILPENHPWLKPLRMQGGSISGCPDGRAEDYPFFSMQGEEVHEVAVGPVHAGIIEPGHFRFMCTGETVRHLEIRLGYQHRGIERLMNSPAAGAEAKTTAGAGASANQLERRLLLAESVCGDSVIAHAGAAARCLESLAGFQVPLHAQAVRAVLLELERIAAHVGDLGAICGDVAYTLGSSAFGAIRTLALNATLSICGNRFGRGLVALGGVKYGLGPENVNNLMATLARVREDVKRMGKVMFSSPSVLSRLEKTGCLGRKAAQELGLVGVPSRASGVDIDIRSDHPEGIYRSFPVQKAIQTSGDVFARAYVRYLEIENSLDFIAGLLKHAAAPAEPPAAREKFTSDLRGDTIAIALVEGWRGEVAYAAITDDNGNLSHLKIKDPSFTNWFGLAQAMRGGGISDFPLCNKSFNLSYCGHDL